VRLDRRAFVAGAAAAGALPWRALGACAGAPPSAWDQVPAILARITPPIIPARRVALTDHGAKGDGAFDCSGAFARAIAALNDEAGPG